MKKKILGIPIALFVIGILFVGGVSAALLDYFGVITSETTVVQSVLVDGTALGVTLPDDGEDNRVHTLTNQNTVSGATVMFETTQCIDSVDGVCPEGAIIAGIATTYKGVLELTSKNPSTWIATGTKKATLHYTLFGNEFKYKVESESDLTGYIVVYYPDSDATDLVTGKPWNIVNAVNLGGVTDVWTTGDLATSLPAIGDYNANPNEGDSYCAVMVDGVPTPENGYDSYDHCAGAKIWLMPSDDFVSEVWNPSAWLFETDLIAYSDNSEGEITLPANGGGVNFVIENHFNVALTPGTYTITTNVVPVTTP